MKKEHFLEKLCGWTVSHQILLTKIYLEGRKPPTKKEVILESQLIICFEADMMETEKWQQYLDEQVENQLSLVINKLWGCLFSSADICKGLTAKRSI